MSSSIFAAPIDLNAHSSLIYVEGAFGLRARKKFALRAKTADGVLRYASYKISGIVDSTSKEAIAGDVLKSYLNGTKNFKVPIFSSIQIAKEKTSADVLILGIAPEGGEFPEEWRGDIEWAIKHKMHIVSGLHFFLSNDKNFQKLAKANKVTIWDARKTSNSGQIPVGSAKAFHIKKPIVLTVGMDAAIGKMTAAYELAKAAKNMGLKGCVIATGQTAIMIEGWGCAIDALPGDFMAGSVEKMLFEREKESDIFFIEGQGSLFHPGYSTCAISLIHGAVPTHMILVHRRQRKHSTGSRLFKLPPIKQAIHQYEESVLPKYRNSKVIAVALNSEGMSYREYEKYKSDIEDETGLPAIDFVREGQGVRGIISKIIKD